jgi:hypothetical protein
MQDNIRTQTGAIMPVGTRLIAKVYGCVLSAIIAIRSDDENKSCVSFMGKEFTSLTGASDYATHAVAAHIGLVDDLNKRRTTGTEFWAVFGGNKAETKLRAFCSAKVQKKTDGLEHSDDEPIIRLPESEKTVRTPKRPTDKASADKRLAKLRAEIANIEEIYTELPDVAPVAESA